ncbi:30S ribosomal protein S13 [Candidatus Bathyarchaeota archaeon]|nr:MAG: 30S ribosomal protein S13 [Candidatus Bathyarchaeota archaeon B24-2]RLG98203.1 MAG: 30S ribosomal protein S13 [Candidatus Bathyarchaeota archaeon]
MSRQFQHIVRIVDRDLDGSLKVAYALTGLKGIGINLAQMILKKAGIDPDMRLGFLTESEIESLSDIIQNPSKYDIPEWALNRRKDLETGENLHLLGADLELRVKSDIELMKRIKCWKGVRHALGLRVRGQRTKTTGRTGKAVGVRRRRAGRG